MIRVKLSDGKIKELDSMVRTTFWGPDGKQMSAEEFLRRPCSEHCPNYLKAKVN